MNTIFLNVEELPTDLRQNLISLGAQHFSSRGMDGSIISNGFVITAVSIPVIKLLQDFAKTYFSYRSQTKKSLEFKYKGASFKGYTAEEVLNFLNKIQQE